MSLCIINIHIDITDFHEYSQTNGIKLSITAAAMTIKPKKKQAKNVEQYIHIMEDVDVLMFLVLYLFADP